MLIIKCTLSYKQVFGGLLMWKIVMRYDQEEERKFANNLESSRCKRLFTCEKHSRLAFFFLFLFFCMSEHPSRLTARSNHAVLRESSKTSTATSQTLQAFTDIL